MDGATVRQRHDDNHGSDTTLMAFRALLGFTVLVAAVTFVLSFHGLSDYGARVAGATGWLSWLVPVGVDGLTLCAVAATFLLRSAPYRVRLYAWLVFGVAIGASVGGNLSHAWSRHLSPAGMAGAAAWPVLLALASHLVIVTRRTIERQRQDRESDAPAPATPPQPATGRTSRPSQPAAEPATPPASPAVAATDSAPSPRVSQPVRQPTPPKPRRPVNRRSGESRKVARQLYSDGTSCAAIAMRLGTTKRSVERWTADLRQQPPGDDDRGDEDSDSDRAEQSA